MLLHKAAAQAARVSGKSPAPSKGIGSDTLRTPADSPAESSAQSSTASNSSLSSTASRTRTPKNSRAVAGRKRPLSNLATNTGSSQMTTANSPTSANGLPTVTITEIPTQPYNSRMQSPARKAQSPARKTQSPRGIVPSSEMRTPYRTSHIQLGKSKESPAKT
ncbi:hypothetical protein BC937DRAFT_93432 [Endogone sp. FLAS-F59071]|nr:hypothetical protein BC937DRAFT_93432 [Endogone sp. FLAS-F59071]|eukprot:RUS14718.1 hypothetical protein BC937DRAFT_93432 [Endogone sp. FLAS-F59071]